MAIISVVVDNNSRVFRYKAPRGFMFEISDIHAAVIANGNNQGVWVIPYLVEDNITIIQEPREFLAHLTAHIAGQSIDFEFRDSEKTKFITLVRRLDANFTLAIVIHYVLIRATQHELLIEWFRKGR